VKLGRVVVTGLGIICAAGRDCDEFWRTIMSGATALRPSSRPEFTPFGRAITGEIPDAWIAEATTPEDRQRYGRDVLLALIAARQAMQSAQLESRPGTWAERTGLVLGKCQAITPGGPRLHDWIHSTADDLAACVGVSGPRQTIATACSAGSNAVGAGRDRIWTQDADLVLVGGVDVLLAATFTGFFALQSLDTQPCSPYSRSAGLNLGEGAAFLVLERLESAHERGVPVLAEVMGYGLSADAYHATAPDPTGRGAAMAVQRALDDSELDSSCVTYVSGHGTGTKPNDTVERRVMRTVFGARSVPLTSTKSFVGHTLGAAGAVEAVTSVLSIMHGAIPPTVNFGEVQPGDLDFVPNSARQADVDVVVSNSYAFGGNNASLVIARPRPSHRYQRTPRTERAVITGIGLVGRPGIGVPEWVKHLAYGQAGAPGLLTDDELMLRLAEHPFATASVWRQMNGFTRLCMAATRLAVEDARLALSRDRRDGTGLILGSMSGASEVRSSLRRQGIAVEGSRRIHEFTQVTLNAPAGAVCQALAIRGLTTTITSGGVSGTLALEAALDAIALGRADSIVVVAVDEAGAEVEAIYEDLGILDRTGMVRPYDPQPQGTSAGTAAVALLVESPSSARERGADIRARITGIAHASDNYDPRKFDPAGTRYAKALRCALARGEVSAADVGAAIGSAAGTDLDTCESAALSAVLPAGTPVVVMKAITGECEAASGLINVAAPLLLDSEQTVSLPAFRVSDPGPAASRISSPVRRALATSASFGSTYGAVAIERELT